MSGSNSLRAAKTAKDNEFYTRYEDIQDELNHYRDQFKGKTVYCNCDDPGHSAFSQFFMLNFEYFGLKKLICTRYKNSNLFWQFEDGPSRVSYRLEITGKDNCKKIPLKGNGDFRSEECIELLNEADIVCTNPPFSLFREYIAQLIKYNKKFLVIGNKNSVAYKEIFPYIQNNSIWLGYTTPKDFFTPDGVLSGKMQGLTRWWTNLDVRKRHEKLILYKQYSPDDYPSYDNFDGIDVNKITNIPCDFYGKMGVPITFLDSYNPEQFEILGIGTGDSAKKIGIKKNYRGRTDLAFTKNGQPHCPYNRLIIKRRT